MKKRLEPKNNLESVNETKNINLIELYEASQKVKSKRSDRRSTLTSEKKNIFFD